MEKFLLCILCGSMFRTEGGTDCPKCAYPAITIHEDEFYIQKDGNVDKNI